ncbi:dual specificity protein phosphatase 12 [Teratosphaeria nubilosa]|uniref:protein-tyrosine-phosphatase n=1 Tax=Teratosphaeria nubilosa TaxID=161662 RepID=A0A6G1LB90_9PEZI|nr:dual specificity protein phosphatase 12 [Teratosphaeria nubilosa]
MSLLDKVPGELNLSIGGLFTLRRREALHAAGISHVLSVLRLPLDRKLFEGFEHKVVEVDDVEDENLLEHFPACNSFIQDALDSGGGVLVHCAMGKSRSATITCAYLMRRYSITPDQALAQIRESRPLCEPNEGFWKQLQLYHQMATPEDVETTPAYQRWLYQREIELSRACGQAPEAEKIRFEDEHRQDQASDFEMRCRKCRRPLATSQYLAEHSSPSSHPASSKCSHYFLDPLSWMKAELEQGKLDGRLECPKCKTNVGKYAWQGMQCSCGDWIVPGISLAKGRIDEQKSRHKGGPNESSEIGIRMPPGAGGKRSGDGGSGVLAKENL